MILLEGKVFCATSLELGLSFVKGLRQRFRYRTFNKNNDLTPRLLQCINNPGPAAAFAARKVVFSLNGALNI